MEAEEIFNYWVMSW